MVRFFYHPVFHHIVFWLIYFSLNTLRWGMYFDDFEYSVQSNLVEFPIHMIIVYFNLYYLIPKLLPSKIFLYLSSLSFSIVIVSIIRVIVTYELVTTDIWREAGKPGLEIFDVNYLIAVIVGELYVVGFTMAIKLGIDWIKSLRKTRNLENKGLVTELSLLRMQIQPHFFFNTLNNLYALTLAKSDLAPATVLKLSEMMSYVIYKGKARRVSLLGEINHINDYMDLEKLRYGDKVEVDLNVSGTIDNIFIPPLLLFPFLENSFKHGGFVNNKLKITIDIEIKNLTLFYCVENHKRGFYENADAVTQDEIHGIGLQNTIKRLDLLYRDRYTLKTVEDDKTYKIILTIPVYGKMSHP